jgi:nucleotide-binding universal stress UspA family protein
MTVVVAFSPGPTGAAALEHGIAEARTAGDRLVVVNATTGNALVDPTYASSSETTALRERLSSLDVDAELRHDVVPDVAEAVIDAAEEVDARLVVVGIRRRTRVGKLILGSVAQQVILGVDCPVLAVKAPPES